MSSISVPKVLLDEAIARADQKELRAIARADQKELRIVELEKQVTELQTKLETLQAKELWFHTQLKLRRTMEKIELLVKPTNTEADAWLNVTRIDKWRLFFAGEEDYGFMEFKNCIQNISQDAGFLAKRMNRLYGVLNARIHSYIDTREISDYPFREDTLSTLATCLDKVEV